MMMVPRRLAILAVAMLLAACANQPPRTSVCPLLAPGMSYPQVSQLLGMSTDDSTASGAPGNRTTTHNRIVADGSASLTTTTRHGPFASQRRTITVHARFKDDRLVKLDSCSDSAAPAAAATDTGA